MAGAGESYILELTLNEQKSVVATTSYDLPYIASISGPGAINAQGDGNESVYIHGYNFGPIDQPTFFETAIDKGKDFVTTEPAATINP